MGRPGPEARGLCAPGGGPGGSAAGRGVRQQTMTRRRSWRSCANITSRCRAKPGGGELSAPTNHPTVYCPVSCQRGVGGMEGALTGQIRVRQTRNTNISTTRKGWQSSGEGEVTPRGKATGCGVSLSGPLTLAIEGVLSGPHQCRSCLCKTEPTTPTKGPLRK